MHRRAFLLSPALLQAQTRPIRTVVLGASHSHAEGKLRLLTKDPRFEIAGLVPESPEVAARFSSVPHLTREAALADPSIELCFVEGDVPLHAEDAHAALSAGKHVHVEKPPAITLAPLAGLHRLAREKNRLLQQGYMWRFHPAINRMLTMARAGEFGDIFLVRGMISTAIGPAQRRALARFPGGQMFELGCHLIDPIIRLLGRPTRVTPTLRNDAGADGLRDNTAVTFEFARAMAHITSASMMKESSAHRSFEIFGTRGNAILRPIEGAAPQLTLEREGKTELVTYSPFRRYAGEIDELARAIPSREPLSITAEEDLLVQEALLRASGMPV